MIQRLKKTAVDFLVKKGWEKRLPGTDPKDALYSDMKRIFAPKNTDVVSVVFSKDRAMQLDGFLVSYFEKVKDFSPVKVLYHTSDEAHENSYNNLKNIYKDYPVEFIKEINFRNQFILLLEKEKAGRVFFYVDDMLFTRDIDYALFKEIDPLESIVVLSRGTDLTYSTVLAKPLEIPKLEKIENGLLRFRWDEIPYLSDWSYPLGVSGYMFSREEILALCRVSNFKAPNSLESSWQHFNSYFMTRSGVCYPEVATPCIHTNLTQTEGYNNVLGHFSLEELLHLWNQNKRINYKEFEGLPVSEAETKKYSFVER